MPTIFLVLLFRLVLSLNGYDVIQVATRRRTGRRHNDPQLAGLGHGLPQHAARPGRSLLCLPVLGDPVHFEEALQPGLAKLGAKEFDMAATPGLSRYTRAVLRNSPGFRVHKTAFNPAEVIGKVLTYVGVDRLQPISPSCPSTGLSRWRSRPRAEINTKTPKLWGFSDNDGQLEGGALPVPASITGVDFPRPSANSLIITIAGRAAGAAARHAGGLCVGPLQLQGQGRHPLLLSQPVLHAAHADPDPAVRVVQQRSSSTTLTWAWCWCSSSSTCRWWC